MKALKEFILISIAAVLITLPIIRVHAAKAGDVEVIEWPKSTEVMDCGTFTYPTTDTIGSVGKYSVFSMRYNKNMHMEGTIATKLLNFMTNDAFGLTSNVVDYADSQENFIYIGGVVGESLEKLQTTNDIKTSTMIFSDDIKFAKGKRTYTDTPVFNNQSQQWENWIYDYYNNGNGIKFIYDGYETQVINNTSALEQYIKHESETTYVIDFDRAFECLAEYSNARYTKSTEGGITQVTKDENSINVICTKEQTNIINLTAEQIENKNIKVTCVDEQGKQTLDFSLVINVKDITGNHEFDRHINVNGKETDTYGPTSGSILWNFGSEYTGTTTFKKTDLGMILAPNASIRVENISHDGSVWAKTVENTNCEIHQTAYKEYNLNSESGDNKPGEGGDDNKPGEGGDDNKPGEGGDDNKPGEGGDDNKPGEGGGDNKPGEGGDDNKPGESGDDNKPGEGGDDNKPEESGDDNNSGEGNNSSEGGNSGSENNGENTNVDDPADSNSANYGNKTKSDNGKDDGKSNSVKTGDNINTYLYTTITGVIATFICLRKKSAVAYKAKHRK